MIDLTYHQRQAVERIHGRVSQGCPLLALTGLAGSGKTSLIPHLQASLRKESVIGAPTHRAAMVLRRKGLEAETLHALALAPTFTHEYTAALEWCQKVASIATDELAPELPSLIASLELSVDETSLMADKCASYPGEKVMASIGIYAKDYLIGFGARQPRPEILILDEASMVGHELLSLARKVFRQIVLIGDPGQLPPVRDVSVLSTVESVHLSEVHRQAADSSIIQLAHQARQGIPFWRRSIAQYAPEVESHRKICASDLADAPLIVWRNGTRTDVTSQVRKSLGYGGSLEPGEPVVCRVNEKSLRVDGLFNNAMFKIAKVLGPREVILREELSGEEIERPMLLHMEETDGQFVDPDAIVCRWAYAITCHTAQGGEWDTVYVSMPDLNAYANMSANTGRHDELFRWAYTACTRAKKHLGLLAAHEFIVR